MATIPTINATRRQDLRHRNSRLSASAAYRGLAATAAGVWHTSSQKSRVAV